MPRTFTEAARVAARASRARRAKVKADNKVGGDIEIFAIRLHNGFTWQVRRFGGLILESGQQCFGSPAAARATGTKELIKSRRPT